VGAAPEKEHVSRLDVLTRCVSLATLPSALPDLVRLSGVPCTEAQLAEFASVLTVLKALFGGDKAGVLQMPSPDDVYDFLTARIFNVLSRGDGSISLADWQHALSRMGLRLPPSEARLMFNQFDEDGNGRIDRNEFAAAVGSIRQRFLAQLLNLLSLSPKRIVAYVTFIAVIALLLLAFLILGSMAFSDGSTFTATVTGLIPMVGSAVSTVPNPGALRAVFDAVETTVRSFFATMTRR
jgi:hypothetical protein